MMSSPPDPEALAAIRQQLRLLWRCAQALRPEWRAALLLNLPTVSAPRRPEPSQDPLDEPAPRPRTSGRSTERGDIDVLVAHGITSIAEIGQVLALTPEQYHLVFAQLGIPVEAPSIYVLWDCLPLPDKAIGAMLGKTGMQVLGLRKLAIRQVAACMRTAMNPPGHIQVRGPSSASEVVH
jgi:hypothetical protein